MSSVLLKATVRSLRNSSAALNAMATLIEGAQRPDAVVSEADRIEVEIERLRVLVLLLRHDAQASRYAFAVDSLTEEVNR